MKKIIIAFCCLALVLPLPAQVESWFGTGQMVSKNKSGTDDTLRYRILIPEQEKLQKLPVILWLHGKGERGTDNKKQLTNGVDVLADSVIHGRYPAIIIAPQCPPDKYWSVYDKTAATMQQAVDPTEIELQLIALLNEVVKKNNVDASRIYIVGISMGGFGVWDMITRWPEKFAAAVPVCGGGDPSKAGLLKNMPVWAFHGEKDNIIKPSFTKDIMAELQELQPENTSRLTLYPETGHGAWVPAFKEKDLLNWLFSKKR